MLLYAAEDALHIVRRRLDGICEAAGVALADLDIQVITAPTLRLDLEADRNNLADTVARLQPRLLILDPFVRLHRIDENASGEVAPLLAYLRELQRRYGVAVLVVHHARKGAANARAGQALRGSSEFHAWGDSNLYLRRDGDDLDPHRRASRRTVARRPSPSRSLQRGPALALEAVDPPEPADTEPKPARRAHRRGTCRHRRRHARSPSCAPAAASAPPPCTSASLPSSPPAASSRPTKATVSPATDRNTTDNQDETGAQAPTSQFRFPPSLQRAGTGIWEVRSGRHSRAVRFAPQMPCTPVHQTA